MWSDAVQRIATIEGAIRRHEEREEEMKETQVEILASVKAIENFIAKINGGARALVWVGGAFAALGGAVAWIVSHLSVPWTWKP